MLLLQLLLLQLLLDDDDTKGVAIIRSSIAAIIIDQHCHNNETNDVDGRGLWNERKCMRRSVTYNFHFVVYCMWPECNICMAPPSLPSRVLAPRAIS